MKVRLPNGMGGGPSNMQSMIRQAQKMQEQMSALQEELEALTESGLTNTEILAAATGNAAKILWQEGKVGTVAPGAFADLLLVDADPTADLTVLRKLRMVIANGEIAADNR